MAEQPQRKRPSLLRRLALGTAALVGMALLLLAVAGIWLTSAPGRDWLRGTLEAAVSEPGELELRIAALEGPLPGSITLKGVTLADAQGIWLSAEQAKLTWRPLDLLRRHLAIDAIEISDLTLARLPESAAAEDETPEAFSLPRLPLDVTVKHLAVDELSLGETVLGQAARFRVIGALAADAGDAIRSALHAERTDGADGRLAVEAVYRPDDDRLTLDARLSAAEGGLLAHLLGLPGLPATEIALAGDGALSNWRGRLTGALQNMADLQAELRITRDPELRLTASGRVEAGALPDEPPWPLLAGVTDFELTAAWHEETLLDLQNLTIEGTVLRGTLSGQLDSATLESALQAALTVERSDAVDRMVAPASLRRLDVTAEARGPLLQPSVTAEATAQGFAAPGFAAEALTARVSAVAETALDAASPRLAISAIGRVASPGLDPAEAMAPLLGEAIDWEAEGELDLDALRFEATRFSLATVRVTAEGPATLMLESGDVTTSQTIILDDLAALRALTGLELSGGAQLQAELDATDYFAGLRMTVTGTLSDFRSGISVADPLIGPTPSLGADIELAQDGSLTVTAAHLDGVDSWLAADASFPADFASITASFAAGAARLDRLSQELGSRLAGSADVEGTISGAIDDPGSDGQVVLRELRVEDVDLGRIDLGYGATNLASGPRGRVELEVANTAGRFAGTGHFALDDERLALSNLALAGEGTSVKGDLSLPLEGAAMTGELTAQVARLAPWLTLAGQQGDGAAGVRVRLTAPDGRQAVQLAANLADLRYPLGDDDALRVEAAEVSASIADLTRPLAADVQLRATGLQAAPANLEELVLNARGDGDGADFTLAARGDLQGALALDASGRVALEGDQTSLALASLQGTLIGRPLTLQRQARLTMGADRLRLDDLLLDFSGGTMAASADIDRTNLAAELRLDALPLDLIEVAAPHTNLDGSLSGSLQLAGTRSDPRGSARFETADLRLKEAADIPPIEAVVEAGWQGGRLALDGTLSGFADEPARLNLEAPLRLDPESLAITLPGSEPVSGRLAWQGDLAEIWPLVPLDGHRLAGRAELGAQLAGSLDAPRLTGNASLANGFYENLGFGTLLKDISLDLELTGEQARLVSLTAIDGKGGRLSADGALALIPERGLPFTLNTDFTDFTLVRRDDATIVSDGKITLDGSTERAAVHGTVTTKRAEIRITRDLPPEVVELQVIEVNAAAIGRSEAPPAAAAPGAQIALDLVIDMPGRIFVRGQGLDSEWGGNLKITGTADAPIINGELSVVRGQLTVIGRTFQLDKGVVSFTGGEEINPLLDVAARYEGSDLTVTALVTGSAQDPQFELTSQPSLPQDEILSRVLFGKSSAQLTAFEAVQLAQVAADLTGKGGQGAGLLDRARTVMGVDVLRVEADESGAPTVAAGRYLTEKVYVGVRQGAAASSGSVGVEVELTPHISVKSDVGQTGESDIGINFKWDY
ncbi:MAG: translocation/assembly module TamB domain-containing protein [Kiloniellales bacterium]